MIIRSETKSNFTCIPNAIFADDRLTRKAKCLLLELLSKPENWNINYKYLVNSGKEGECAIRAGINELIDAGYIHKEIPRQNGKISKTEHYIYDRSMTADEHREVVGADNRTLLPTVTQPDEYPNHQGDLFQADEPSTLRGEASPNLESVDIPMGENHVGKITMGKTAPIINTDRTNTEGTTTTAEAACACEAELESVVESSSPSSYPATCEINNLLDLIPDRFRQPMVDNVVMNALKTFTPDQVTDAILYASDNVRGGHMQFKTYLNRAINEGWGNGYQQAREKPVIRVHHHDPFEIPKGRYPNGTVTGSKRMDSNLAACVAFAMGEGGTI